MSLKSSELQTKLGSFQKNCRILLGDCKKALDALNACGENKPSLTKALEEQILSLEKHLIPALSSALQEEQMTVTETSGGKRRGVRRFRRRLKLKYWYPGHENKKHTAYTRDVGAMGIFIVASRLERVGNRLAFTIDLPDVGPIPVQGTVVWNKWVPTPLQTTEYSGFGVQFTYAPEEWFTYFMRAEAEWEAEHTNPNVSLNDLRKSG